MKEHPILFSTPMVQAILENRKKQTRRTNGLDSVNEKPGNYEYKGTSPDNPFIHFFARMWKETWVETIHIKCPYGCPGDILWVRETFAKNEQDGKYDLKADYASEDHFFGWKPSIHMPKLAARIWLEISEVKVERLQDISEEDAKAEGVKLHKEGRHYLDYIAESNNTTQFIYRLLTAKQSFKSLWELVNERNKNFIERHGICWIDNPWVWVIKFKVISTTGKPETL